MNVTLLVEGQAHVTLAQIVAAAKKGGYVDVLVAMLLDGRTENGADKTQDNGQAPTRPNRPTITLEEAQRMEDQTTRAIWIHLNWDVSQELAEKMVASKRPLAELAAMDGRDLNDVFGIRIRDAVKIADNIHAHTPPPKRRR